MGLDGTLSVIPPNEWRKLRADPMHYVARDAGKFELYREWCALDVALGTMNRPLNLALRGNRPRGEDDEGYFGYVTPGLVKRISAAVEKISEDELLAALKAAGWNLRKHEYKSCISALKTLRVAYRTAAKKGACLSILIC